MVHHVENHFVTNRSFRSSSTSDSSVPLGLPELVLLLVVPFEVSVRVLLKLFQILLVLSLLVLYFASHELCSQPGKFFVCFLLLLELLCFLPDMHSTKAFFQLLLESESRVNDVRTIVRALDEFLQVNLISSSELVLLDPQACVDREQLNKGFLIDVPTSKHAAELKHIDLRNNLIIVLVKHAEHKGDHLHAREHVESTKGNEKFFEVAPVSAHTFVNQLEKSLQVRCDNRVACFLKIIHHVCNRNITSIFLVHLQKRHPNLFEVIKLQEVLVHDVLN
jgi:hypothetical protein